MATSPYFNHYTATNEQDLIENRVIEAIQHRGIDVVYIERTQADLDTLFNEDPANFFTEKDVIEMWPAFVDGFEGQGEYLNKFGLDLKQAGTFIVSKKRFSEVFPDFIRPREGDLIFMPITNAILEIKFVAAESPFFQKGKQYVWEVKTETFEYGHEDFTVEDDDALGAIEKMIVSDYGDSDYTIEDDPFADNDNIEEEVDPLINQDGDNPFGII